MSGGSAILSLVLALAPQARRAEAMDDYKAERARVLIACGQRHLDYGLELRKKGLAVPAAAQITLGVDASLGKNENARFILGLLRQLDDGFWKRRVEHPSAASLGSYEKQARKLRAQDLEDRAGVVQTAVRLGLDEVAFEELGNVLRAIDEPLVFDERGALRLAGAKLEGDLATRVRTEAIDIDGQLYVRDAFLQRVPEVRKIFECTTPELRVRSTASAEEAARVHAVASALLPVLYDELGIAPDSRPQIVVLHARKVYARYLDLSGLSSHKGTDGFADRLSGTAVVCAEAPGGEPLGDELLAGIALHELTHLVQLRASPAALPPWFREGSAEKYGGQGTFTWDGRELVTGLPMAAVRLDELRAKPFTLAELFAADPLALLADDPPAARRFYAGSWAFLRFLEQGAGPEIAARLDQWRAACLGAVLGADPYQAYAMDASASQKLFVDRFGADLEQLERDFGTWLAALR